MQNAHSFIFIHGAWHASWCWQRIAKALRAKGHNVLTPDLPGHGSKMCPADRIQFNDYVTCIIEIINQQTEQVTLVGHSMGGLIISQVAEIIPHRIRELVFVAAYIPENQQSLFSIAEASESRGVSPFIKIDQAKQEIRLKSCPQLADIFFNCCSKEDTQYAMSNLQPQPLQPFLEPITVGKPFECTPKRSLVCRYDHALLLSDQLRMSQAVTDNIIYLNADHSAYYSGKSEIIKILS